MYDLNVAVEQLKQRLAARFLNVGIETRKSQGAVPARGVDIVTSAVESVLVELMKRSAVRRIRLEDGFSAIGEGFSGLASNASASYAYLMADVQFDRELDAELLPFAQQGAAPVRVLAGMAERNEGFLQVESPVADTLRFTLRLPIAVGEPWPEISCVSSTGPTVLLVEDEEFVRNVTREVLEMEGFHVLVAEHGLKAIELMEQKSRPIDLLLTDVVLPGMNGRDLGAKLAAIQPGLKIIFMSGYMDNPVLRTSVSSESSTMYLQKPFTLDTLVAKVFETLRLESATPTLAPLQRPSAIEGRELR